MSNKKKQTRAEIISEILGLAAVGLMLLLLLYVGLHYYQYAEDARAECKSHILIPDLDSGEFRCLPVEDNYNLRDSYNLGESVNRLLQGGK